MNPVPDKHEPLLSESERERIGNLIARQVRKSGAKSRKSESRFFARDFLSEQRAHEHIALLRSLVPGYLDGARLLEVGSGYGLFLACARRCEGLNAFGIEPGQEGYMLQQLASEVLAATGISEEVVTCAEGEHLPFGDELFDVVCSWNVLEHVRDPCEVIYEAYRVLKPGGRIVFNIPNYNSFWEGHYSLPWLPLFNWRPLGRFYLRVMGRNASVYESLQFITPRKIRKWLGSLPGPYRVVTMGKSLCAERLRGAPFAGWGGLQGIKRVRSWLHRLRLIEPAIWVLNLLDAQYPIVMVVEKEGGEERGGSQGV